MSLDYALYEALKHRRHPAARWWIIGDRLYYAGLIPALVSAPLSLLACAAAALGRASWWWPAGLAGLVVVSSVVFGAALACKGRAYRMARQDGIDAEAALRK